MKIKVTFEVDCEVLKNFISAMENRNSTPDEVIENYLITFTDSEDLIFEDEDNNSSSFVDSVDDDEDDYNDNSTADVIKEYVELTEKLIMKCKKYRIGTMARILLRKFLPNGVATENEIKAMQRVPSKKADELNMPYGDYSNRKFGLNFPLLVKEGTSEFLRAQCWKDPIQIGDETYYICAQWFEQPNNNDRIPL